MLDHMRNLPLDDRLALIESTLHDLREELQSMRMKAEPTVDWTDRERLLREGAAVMASEYADDAELTAFTSLDGEGCSRGTVMRGEQRP